MQFEAKKLDSPTNTGTFCLSSDGAKTGSVAIKSSKRKNKIKKTTEVAKEATTIGSDR